MPGATFDSNKAVLFGRFVVAAYTMYRPKPHQSDTAALKRLSSGIQIDGLGPDAGLHFG